MGVQGIMDVITKAQRALATERYINNGEPDAGKLAHPVRGDGMVETR